MKNEIKNPVSSLRQGFTLIEILLVVILLAVMAAITLPRFNQSYEQLQLRDATNDIAYLMRYAQSRAIHTTRPLKLMFNDQKTGYRLMQAKPESEEAAEDEQAISYENVPGQFGRLFKTPEGMTIEPTQPSVTFSSDGRIEKIQIDVCLKKKCLIVSTQNQSGYVVVGEAAEEVQ